MKEDLCTVYFYERNQAGINSTQRRTQQLLSDQRIKSVSSRGYEAT